VSGMEADEPSTTLTRRPNHNSGESALAASVVPRRRHSLGEDLIGKSLTGFAVGTRVTRQGRQAVGRSMRLDAGQGAIAGLVRVKDLADEGPQRHQRGKKRTHRSVARGNQKPRRSMPREGRPGVARPVGRPISHEAFWPHRRYCNSQTLTVSSAKGFVTESLSAKEAVFVNPLSIHIFPFCQCHSCLSLKSVRGFLKNRLTATLRTPCN